MATKKLKQDTLTPSQKDDAGAPVSLTADQELAMGIVERWNRLDEVARYYLSQWEAIGAYVMPRKSYILTTLIVPDMDREANLFTSIGVQSNMTLASGCMSYITPSDSRWFALEPTEPMEDDDDAREWFAHGTEIVQQYLANSNFYTTMHEFYLDRGCFGTAVLHVEPGDTDDTPLIFRTFDVGKFRLSENHERLVDTLFYRDKFTVRQLVLQFGAEMSPNSPAKNTSKRMVEDTILKLKSSMPFTRVQIVSVTKPKKMDAISSLPRCTLKLKPSIRFAMEGTTKSLSLDLAT